MFWEVSLFSSFSLLQASLNSILSQGIWPYHSFKADLLKVTNDTSINDSNLNMFFLELVSFLYAF